MPRELLRKQKLNVEDIGTLQKILIKRILTIFSIITVLGIFIIFFGPKIGYLFGYFSKNRNVDDSPTYKPNSPVLANIPTKTKDDGITINGYAEPGNEIVLYVNNSKNTQTISQTDGLFTFVDIQLSYGTNSLYAISNDKAGIQSDPTNTYQVTVDKIAPKLDITEPKADSTIRNLDKRITIIGKVNEKSSVKVNGKTAVVKPDLTFEFLLGVNEGEVKIEIVATDEAGNETKQEFKVKYSKTAS